MANDRAYYYYNLTVDGWRSQSDDTAPKGCLLLTRLAEITPGPQTYYSYSIRYTGPDRAVVAAAILRFGLYPDDYARRATMDSLLLNHTEKEVLATMAAVLP